MAKLISFLIALFVFTGLFVVPVSAVGTKEVTIVNPIRGKDFWDHPYDFLDTSKKQYELISKYNIEATWLVRYDALKDDSVISLLKTFNPKQEIGIFLEVTPSLTSAAGVDYKESQNWHYAKSVLVTGYSPEDRKKLIDVAMNKYKEVFGRNPKSVGAWWIDADSLTYMKSKYGVEVNLDVSDQFSTDGYQVWGQYWSAPFFPAKRNALMPASSEGEKIGMVTIQWAHRDPFNGYGNSVFESTYSVQANDYMLHDLGIDYFNKLVAIYPQITVGLENDFSWEQFGAEYSRQIESLSRMQNQNQLQIKTMENFGKVYRQENPNLSPKLPILADDPLETGGKVLWYQTPRYRVGWFYGNQGSVIRDLREFNDGVEEACLKKACEELKLGFTANQAIDEINYGTKWVLDEGKISDIAITETNDGLQLQYKNQSGITRTITFLANDIKVDDEIKTISAAILQAVETSQNQSAIINQDEKDFISKVEWSSVLPSMTIDGAKFLLFVFLFLLLPGYLFSRKWFLAIPVGIALFTLLAYLTSWIRLDFLLWLIPVKAVIGLVYYKVKPPKIQIARFDLLTFLLIIIGSATWLLTQVKNGLLFNYGYGYWGPNGHDGIWHLQLINALTKGVAPDNFVFAGEKLENYHYFYDLLVAKVVTLFGIDAQHLLFRLFPILLSISIGYVVYYLAVQLAQKINITESRARLAGLFSLFFVYFGGSFGWLVSFVKDRTFGGETTFWAQQSISTLLNPPFAASLLLLFAGLYVYYAAIGTGKKEFWRKALLLILLWGVLIEFKAYAGVLLLAALGVVTLWRLIKRDFVFSLISFCVLLISLLVFLPNNSSSNSLIIFQPLWLVQTMVEFQDRLGWNRLLMTMQSGVWYKVFAAYIIGIVIFVLGNFGTRIISLLEPRIYKQFGLMGLISIFGFVCSMLFLQKGTNWNIVQFFYYSLMIQAVFAGIVIAKYINKIPKVFAGVVVIILILLTIPTTLDTFKHYLPKRPPAKISTNEIQILTELSKQPDGVVLSPIYDERLNKQFGAPKPLFAYASTAYVSAISGKPSFVEDLVNLEILGIEYKGRVNTTREILKGTPNAIKLLNDNNVSYIYLPKKGGIKFDEGKLGLDKIKENEEAVIYKVKR